MKALAIHLKKIMKMSVINQDFWYQKTPNQLQILLKAENNILELNLLKRKNRIYS